MLWACQTSPLIFPPHSSFLNVAAPAPKVERLPDVTSETSVQIEEIVTKVTQVAPPPPPKPVDIAPQFIQDLPTSISVEQGESFTVTVSVEALPEASFTWYVDNREISESAVTRFERPEKNVRRVTFTAPITSGEYKVIASNRAGSALTFSEVTVKGRC